MNLLLSLVIFSVMSHKYFHYSATMVVVMMMMTVEDCSQISMDNKRQHTLLVISLEDRVPMLDQQEDNEDYSRIAVVHVVKLEMRLANRVVRMDIFLPLLLLPMNDDVSDEGDSQLLAMLISLLSGDGDDDDDCCLMMSCGRCYYWVYGAKCLKIHYDANHSTVHVHLPRVIWRVFWASFSVDICNRDVLSYEVLLKWREK